MEENKAPISVEERLKEKQADLTQVKGKIAQIDQQVMQLQKNKDQLLTLGIELQGMIKLLSEMSPKVEEPKKVELAEKK